MFSLESALIDTYRIVTHPARYAHRWWMVRTGTLPVIILFYHRVSDDHPTPWTIRRREFQRQIEWLRSQFEIVDLAEAQRRLVSGKNDRPTVAITFDDGYAENFEWAIPYLVESRVPLTYFVTLENLLTGRPFAHDVAAGYNFPVNTLEQIRAMAQMGVEIGGHSRTHPNLGSLTDGEQLHDEVVQASRQLSEAAEAPVRYFAFPFGQKANLNPRAFHLAKEAGMLGVCSAFGGFNQPGGDAFHLKRIHGDPNFSRLRNWLTYDHRLFRVADYDLP